MRIGTESENVRRGAAHQREAAFHARSERGNTMKDDVRQIKPKTAQCLPGLLVNASRCPQESRVLVRGCLGKSLAILR